VPKKVPQKGDQPAARPSEQISPADIQSMFDAMTVMDAEKYVELSVEQFPTFVQRLRKLQDARNAHVRRHNRALAELRALANPQTGRADDATIESKLKEMDTIEVEATTAIANARDAVDQMLSAKQRARFRLLEDNMERKKLDFLTKVRQNGRGGF